MLIRCSVKNCMHQYRFGRVSGFLLLILTLYIDISIPSWLLIYLYIAEAFPANKRRSRIRRYYGARTIRCGQFVARQFVAIMGQWKISTRKLEHEPADVTLELERTLLTSPSPSPSLTLILTPSHPRPHPHWLSPSHPRPHPHTLTPAPSSARSCLSFLVLIFPVPAMIWLNYTIATNCPATNCLATNCPYDELSATNCPWRIVRSPTLHQNVHRGWESAMSLPQGYWKKF